MIVHLFTFVLLLDASSYVHSLLTQEAIVEKVNADPSATWKATHSHFLHQKQACALNETDFNEELYQADNFQYIPHNMEQSDLPVNFDGRLQWSYCQSMTDIRDQGQCGSCWAFGAVEAMSDRICIGTQGATQVNISAENLISCCILCGLGCYGGLPKMAWYYWVHSGIVTGGQYCSNSGCQPYEIPPTEQNLGGIQPTPTCHHNCERNYKISYDKDKYYGKSYYSVPQNETEIMAEIYKYGPVDSLFLLYDDFYSYESGVYQHMHGEPSGFHSVRLIGWGVDNEVKYWLAANSWGRKFGEDGGYFRILRGVNECGIEDALVAGRYI